MSIGVPFLDLKAQNVSLAADIQQRMDRVVREGCFILGPAVEEFEREFAAFVGARHCVGLNSGTSALHMALIACGVGPGDEVITTPHTWISTSWAISYVGAVPVYVDIDPETYCLDPAQVERAVTARTKAILPVHLYGQAADVVALREVAARHGLLLIEDAAQAHGSRVNGRSVGTFGRVGCFSFYPGKNLGAFGEAGAIVTDDEEVAERVRRLRDHGQAGRHHHVELGFNTRMEGLQGAVLSAKLPHLDRWNELRRQHADRYFSLLDGVDEIQLPLAAQRDAHVWHLFVVLLRGVSREELRPRLSEMGVATGVHYPVPVPFQPAYAALGYARGSFPIAQDVMARCLSLPMFPEMSETQIDQVVKALKMCLPKNKASIFAGAR
jgi:dTDP-4-amino-4,6-dideoxygalactose transaminase